MAKKENRLRSCIDPRTTYVFDELQQLLDCPFLQKYSQMSDFSHFAVDIVMDEETHGDLPVDIFLYVIWKDINKDITRLGELDYDIPELPRYDWGMP